MARTKPLVMVVDGDVRGLQVAARAASAVTADIAERIAAGEKDARASLEDYGLAFDKLANVSKTAMSQMAANINAEFRNMARDAERAARLGEDFNPAAGFTAQSQQQYADNTRKLAAEAFRVSDAYAKVAAQGGELAAVHSKAAADALLTAKNFTLEADAAELVADELRKVEVELGATAGTTVEAGKQVTGTTGAMRAGFQQVGFQISDFAVQVGGGTSAIRAASQQAPQLIGALALMGEGVEGSSSRFSRFAAILQGPWGAAITVGVSILGAMAASLLDTEDAAEGAGDAHETLADKLDLERHSYEEVIEAMKEYNAEQVRSRELTLDAAKATALKAAEDLRAALAIRQKIKAEIEGAAATAAGSAGQGFGGATSVALGVQGKAEARLRENDAEIRVLTEGAQNAVAGVAEEIAKINSDGRYAIDQRFRRLRNEAKASIKDVDALARKLSELNRQEASAEKAYDKAQNPGRRSAGTSGGNENALGGTVALLRQLFPGVQITSTTGGKHVKGSDHYAGRGIDFIPAGGVNSLPFEEVKRRVEEAGIKIRRNASGREQFFGPGHGAKTRDDHNDHFHLGFEGSPSPEAADRAATQRAEKAQRSREALEGALLASREEQARLARLGVTDAARLAELDIAAIDAGLERKLAQNAKLELDHKEIDALDRANAETEKRAVTEKLRAELAEKAIEKERQQLDDVARLIELQGQLATTPRERKAAAQNLLDIWRSQALLGSQETFAKDGDFSAMLDRDGQIRREYDAQKRNLQAQNQGPLGDYREQLRKNVGDIDSALEGVGARGLQSLEDGLVGVLTGTENVATAFKRMAASILADLARIAVQKLILKAIGFGFSDGNVPAKAVGHVPGFAGGIISGPGTGTSDSIFAAHESLGLIRVSNGESIITAEGTRKHRRLLKAINDNTLPSFAGGMVADVAYPSIPSAASLRAGGPAPVQYFDLRGSVVLEELYRTMHQISAAHAGQALAAAPSLAMSDMAEHNAQRIPV